MPNQITKIFPKKMTTKFLILCFSLLLASLFLPGNCQLKVIGQASGHGIKGMFVFGSSIVDNGNNNFLQTNAKANYLPYGVDFPGGPSGRFSNGKNIIDLLGEHLRLPCFIPPSADPSTKGNKIIHGVNFASGGTGILDNTGSVVGRVFNLNEQMKTFETVTLPELEVQLGSKSQDSLSKYLFVFGVGGNDYTFNYFMPKLNVNVLAGAFASNLTNSLSQHIQKLYSLGGRKFVVMSIYPIGCTPMAKTYRPMAKGCVEELNRAVQNFNIRLKSMVDLSKQQLPGSNFVYINQNKIISDIIKHPITHGFKDGKKPCCEESPIFGGGNRVSCKKDGRVCPFRKDYIYFDGLHPTEAVNAHIAHKGFASLLKDEAYPINVKQLASL